MKALRAFALFSFLFCQLWWPYSAYAAPYSGTGLAKGSVMGISGSRFQPGGTTTSGFSVGSTAITGYSLVDGQVIVGRETPFNFFKGAAMAAGTIIDGISINPSALRAGLLSTIKGGLLTLAGGYLADQLLQKGWQWMTDAKCQVTASCWMNEPYSAIPYNATYDTAVCMQASPSNYCTNLPNMKLTSALLLSNWSALKPFLTNICSHSAYPKYIDGTDRCYSSDGSSNRSFSYVYVGSATANQPRPKAVVPDATIDSFADGMLANNPKQVVQDYVDHNLPLPYVDSGTTRLKEPKVAPPPYVGTTTIHNPDGSTTVINTGTETEVLVSPDGGVTTRDNETKTTTTTNPDGTTSTTTQTSQTANPPQVETKDTAKELTPLFGQVVDAINAGVAAIGSAITAAVTPLTDAVKSIRDFINPSVPDPDTSTKKTPNESVPVALDTTDKFMGGTAGCPPPLEVSFTLGGQSATIPLTYEPICLFASYMRPFFVLTAYITAAFIIFRN